MICPRCLKDSPAEIHTCTPTDFVRDLERQLAECQRERDHYKVQIDHYGELIDTVTAERDELAECLKDAFPHDTHMADGCDCPWCKALAKVGADKGDV